VNFQGNQTVGALFGDSGTSLLLGKNSQLKVGPSDEGEVQGEGGGKFDGTISGEGALAKSGDDTLILTGANDYQGKTTISGGTLEVTGTLGTTEAASSSYAYDAPITNNGTLHFNQKDNQTLSGILSGEGTLIKEGAGTLTLTGVNSYEGDILVSGKGVEGENGKLILGVEKAIQNSTQVTVTNGATLQLGPAGNGIDQTLKHLILNNKGIVDFGPGNIGHTLTLGNLDGETQEIKDSLGVFRLDAQLSGDGSITDKLIIKGNVNGYFLLDITPAPGSTGAATTQGLQVVQLGEGDGKYSETREVKQGKDAFALIEGGAIGAYQYVLDYKENSGWYLIKPMSLYSPAAANAVAAQEANAEQGFLQLASLHQRIGEHRNLSSKLQTWLKTSYFKLRNEGQRRFGFDQKTNSLQAGQEVLAQTTESGDSVRAALSIDYARSDTRFEDRERPSLSGLNLSAQTGKMEATSLALGGYVTRTAENGAYLDLVGQVASLRNKFQSSAGGPATQKGWRAGLSVEGGYPLWTAGEEEDWRLEGQAQLGYQYTHYQSFQNSSSQFDQYHTDNLRARLGLRLTHTLKTAQDKTLQTYGFLNIAHDFLTPEALRIGDKAGNEVLVEERYAKSHSELGFGVQGYVSKSMSVFGDVRYQRGIGKSGEREGGAFNFGVRFEF
jgi:outer membrane autotransporter protein